MTFLKMHSSNNPQLLISDLGLQTANIEDETLGADGILARDVLLPKLVNGEHDVSEMDIAIPNGI